MEWTGRPASGGGPTILARDVKSSPTMAVLAVLLGFCLSKPPEATRLATSASFGLPRGASSYLPRKQQRVRALSARPWPAASAQVYPRAPKATPSPHRLQVVTRPLSSADPAPIRARAQWDARPHPLRC
jgi:hypothetical protein